MLQILGPGNLPHAMPGVIQRQIAVTCDLLYDRFRMRKWVWMMSVIDMALAIVVGGRFFHYVANDARISNSPPTSELEDRITLLWVWFVFLGAYTCQILMSVALILTTRCNDWQTCFGNCTLYIHGAHALNGYTAIELIIFAYYAVYKTKSFSPTNLYILTIFSICKATFRSAMFCTVKCFMRDLARMICTCRRKQYAIEDEDMVADNMEGNLLPRRSWPTVHL